MASSNPIVGCTRCPRLTAHLSQQRQVDPASHNAPVPTWGNRHAPLLIVGLAPGRLGANRTGYPFWGDASGNLVMQALVSAGASDLGSDPPQLSGVRLTNAVACLPPKNRPNAHELKRCREAWLVKELHLPAVILTLGRLAHESVCIGLGVPRSEFPFTHAAKKKLDHQWIVSSYHPSPLNTRTGRLSETAFIHLVHEALRMATDASS